MDKENNSGKPFINEKIRKKPINTRRLFKRTATTAVMAVFFGVIACLTILLMEPVINKLVNPEKVTRVSFPEEEVPVDQLLTEQSKAQQEKVQQQEALDKAKEEIVREVVEGTIQQQEEEEETRLESYVQVFEEMSAIARSAQPYLVTVVSSTQIESWLRGSYEEEKSFSGIIVADNTQSFLILVDLQGNTDGHYTITFADGKYVQAQIQRMDPETGLAVFAIEKSKLEESTIKEIRVADLGSSADQGIVGRPVIAVGSPQGVAGSVSYGFVTANNSQLLVTDANYGVILTDMSAGAGASGVLLNLSGTVIGMIVDEAQGLSSGGGLVAVGISELKGLITKLSNNEPWGYLGVRGMGVTSQVHEQTGVPFGAFVAEVESESPAMQSGINNGDIITQIGNTSISSFRELRSMLLTTLPGETYTVKVMRQTGDEYQEFEMEVLLSSLTQ
ncbi:MAG: S1C family serine protease [Lachnospiraceae bacterium]|nr:S1C family serine protease [Lachnospiraceae bacterium]